MLVDLDVLLTTCCSENPGLATMLWKLDPWVCVRLKVDRYTMVGIVVPVLYCLLTHIIVFVVLVVRPLDSFWQPLKYATELAEEDTPPAMYRLSTSNIIRPAADMFTDLLASKQRDAKSTQAGLYRWHWLDVSYLYKQKDRSRHVPATTFPTLMRLSMFVY